MKPNEKKLLELLSNQDVTFFIPPYQRNYEWTEEQCRILLNDITKTAEANINSSHTEHFLGSVTYFSVNSAFGQPARLVLVDGQQRITTTMLFLAALRDIVRNEIAKLIDSRYLKNNNVTDENNEYKIKLKQVERDWNSYKKIMIGERLEGEDQNSAVYKNYKFFARELKKIRDDDDKNLKSLIECGLDKFSIITIELEPDKNNWENPQEIFESMNSIGKPLSLADLVRNYLLLGLEPEMQTEYYEQFWLDMERVLPNEISSFIRDYMQAKDCRSYPIAKEQNHKELYSAFKELFKCNGDEEKHNLLKSLREYSPIYASIVLGKPIGNASIDSILQDLRTVKITTAYSLLLELLHSYSLGDFSDHDIIEILEALRIYCFRRRLLELNAAENKNFPILTSKIQQLKDANDKKLKMFELLSRQEYNMRLPNDIEIKTGLHNNDNFYHFGYCKFYLSLVEEKITKARPSLNDKNLQIEHIMPQTLTDEWRRELGDSYEDIQLRLGNHIGNLTLIRHNQELGNKSFSDKKHVYENAAGLQIARTNITNVSHWNEASIKQRADWIISCIAKEVLPIPDDMRNRNNFTEKKGLSFIALQLIGERIAFIDDTSITALVVNDKEVEFEGKIWHLSPLTRELKTRRGNVNNSGAYQGAQYWEHDGRKLADIM